MAFVEWSDDLNLRRYQFRLVDILLLTFAVAFCCLCFRTGQYNGWVSAIVLVSLIMYWCNHVVCNPRLVPSTLFLFPILFALFLISALILGMHHPPFMVPEDWKWPPFESFEERIIHAFALSVWTVIFGLPTIVWCGIVRRVALSCQMDRLYWNEN